MQEVLTEILCLFKKKKKIQIIVAQIKRRHLVLVVMLHSDQNTSNLLFFVSYIIVCGVFIKYVDFKIHNKCLSSCGIFSGVK